MSFMDRMKQKADELDLEEKAEQLTEAATKAAKQAKETAAKLADENRDKVGAALDRAEAAIDKRTEGKYAEQVAKAKGKVVKGVDKLAEQHTRPRDEEPPQDAPPAPSAG